MVGCQTKIVSVLIFYTQTIQELISNDKIRNLQKSLFIAKKFLEVLEHFSQLSSISYYNGAFLTVFDLFLFRENKLSEKTRNKWTKNACGCFLFELFSAIS